MPVAMDWRTSPLQLVAKVFESRQVRQTYQKCEFLPDPVAFRFGSLSLLPVPTYMVQRGEKFAKTFLVAILKELTNKKFFFLKICCKPLNI
jgi:hypothetical protein